MIHVIRAQCRGLHSDKYRRRPESGGEFGISCAKEAADLFSATFERIFYGLVRDVAKGVAMEDTARRRGQNPAAAILYMPEWH